MSLRELAKKATPGPWGWFGNVDHGHQMYLATQHSGRLFVMGFKRWGMQEAQPVFRHTPKGEKWARMTPASERAIKQVEYRGDIADLDFPDAQFMAACDPTTVLGLLDEIDRLREERQAVINCVNLYGDEILHAALDDIGFAPRKAVSA